MKLQRTFLMGVIFLGLASAADAQLLPRWFAPKTPDKSPSAKSAVVDPRRLTEVNVEVAWLADPVTFPYYLEAHATASQLEVRGYVPNKAVREHAMRIAQVYSSLPVVDSIKEHPSLLVKPSQMSPLQLQSSVLSSLKVALPKNYQQLKAECGSDGKVYVVGTVSTYEEKMAVSHSLRRLHGCTSVENLTTVLAEIAQTPPREKTPIINTSNSKERPVVAIDAKAKSWWPFAKTPASKPTTEEPPLFHSPAIVDAKDPRPSDGPILIPNVSEPKKDIVKVENATPLTASELQKRIKKAFPKIKSVEAQFVSNQEVRITLELASESELKATAERVFAMPELQNYRPELQFKISAP
jgi:hypothetical protein